MLKVFIIPSLPRKIVGLSFLPLIIVFCGCISLGGCPPTYGIDVHKLEETEFPYTNVTRADLSSVPMVLSLLDDILNNDSINYKSIYLEHNEWNETLMIMKGLNFVPKEPQHDQWIILYNAMYFEIYFFIMVC